MQNLKLVAKIGILPYTTFSMKQQAFEVTEKHSLFEKLLFPEYHGKNICKLSSLQQETVEANPFVAFKSALTVGPYYFPILVTNLNNFKP